MDEKTLSVDPSKMSDLARTYEALTDYLSWLINRQDFEAYAKLRPTVSELNDLIVAVGGNIPESFDSVNHEKGRTKQMKFPIELSPESYDCLVKHIANQSSSRQSLAISDFSILPSPDFAVSCDEPTAQALLHIAKKYCPEAVRSIQDGIRKSLIRKLLLGGFAAYVAYEEYRRAREKFKVELFSKQFAVFAATRILLTHIKRDGQLLHFKDLWNYRAATWDATFLFDKEIAEYLEDIYQHAIKLHADGKMMETVVGHDKRSHLATAISENLRWLNNQLPALTNRFAPYMRWMRNPLI
jgi:hypothetical protein